MKVTQMQFAEELAARMGITFTQAESFVKNFKILTYQHLAAGNSVELSGFGQFRISHRQPRLGVNPRTMVRITIPALNTPKFKAGQAFKDAVAIN